jgi:transcriptional regulator
MQPPRAREPVLLTSFTAADGSVCATLPSGRACGGNRAGCTLQKMSIRDNRRDQLQGTLDLLVLRTLDAGGTLHGYDITERIQRISGEFLRVEAGSLYPALHRMEEAGWVVSEWARSENNRRARFYAITAAGKRRLTEEKEHWTQLTAAVARVLRYA